ncbi:hypothetical protein BH23THE1_BH23THE1_08770 [soil metagenome]
MIRISLNNTILFVPYPDTLIIDVLMMTANVVRVYRVNFIYISIAKQHTVFQCHLVFIVNTRNKLD